ncbi:hypothetical protein IV203_029902 [Nitzschia inconspicua]|uniref:Uncharacterized protein n=1 Tax=Nitzschia inconspicua TaxID=303405 RepID=A0A9K3LV44_9STRA|nr:hypothetical protein IV203_029902 [Nitzschia inconspicua]
MSNRKLNSRPITDFFTPVKKTQDETVTIREHAATNVTTTSTSSPSPSSLVTNPLSTRTGGPSSRLVTTQKKRKDPPVVSTTTLDASASSTFFPRKKVETSAIYNQEAEVEVVLEEEELEEPDSSQEEEAEEGDEGTIGTDFQPIEIGGELTACAIIQPFCVESANIVKEENFFETPFGKFAEHLKKRSITCNSGVYCILSEDGTMISKIGSTKNFQRRYQSYREQWDIEKKQFFIMVDFSNTNERVDQRMNESYNAMIQALMEADNLDPFQKYLVHTLMERGGDRLGPKETSWLQMIEIGLQHQFGLSAVSDSVMYDPRVAQGLYNTASTQATRLMRHLSVLSSKVENGETIQVKALSSWMSGVKYLSSNVVTSKCILGEQFQDQF